jgi:hypothetical protein
MMANRLWMSVGNGPKNSSFPIHSEYKRLLLKDYQHCFSFFADRSSQAPGAFAKQPAFRDRSKRLRIREEREGLGGSLIKPFTRKLN